MIKACPRIPTNVSHESFAGIAHRKFNPAPIKNMVKTNKLLAGKAKRVSWKLLKKDINTFCLRR